MRNFTLQTECLLCHWDFALLHLTHFVRQACPAERKLEMLAQYGRMVLKWNRQRRIGMITFFDARENMLVYLGFAVPVHLRNTKKIWFCPDDLLNDAARKVLSFREIGGTGFGMAAVSGVDRVGKGEVMVKP